MNCYQKWSWAAGPASKGQVHRFLIKDEAGPQARFQNRMKAPLHSSGRSGSLGWTRRIRQVRGGRTSRAGRARANRAGRGGPGGPGLEQYFSWSNILWFLDSFLNILPASNLLLKLDTRKDNHKLSIFLENRPYCPIVHGWKNMNDIPKIIITRGPNYWSTVSNGITKIAINQVFDYWSSTGPIYC